MLARNMFSTTLLTTLIFTVSVLGSPLPAPQTVYSSKKSGQVSDLTVHLFKDRGCSRPMVEEQLDGPAEIWAWNNMIYNRPLLTPNRQEFHSILLSRPLAPGEQLDINKAGKAAPGDIADCAENVSRITYMKDVPAVHVRERGDLCKVLDVS